ncbi:MAG: HD domain-containing protein, partial [Gemmatimonadaceae bacterium]
RGMSELTARECARMDVSRELHGALAEALPTDGLPGLDRHLLQSREIRDSWASVIGQVSASHNWPLREVEDKLGRRGTVPAPVSCGGTYDPGYVACLLRVIDYAHVNAARARFLDRTLRARMSPASLLHWRAQEFIGGPQRQDDSLVFASNQPIADVDGWWTFFELVRGLNVEIEEVSEYLESRTSSRGRFSLRGVRGASSARQFAELVQTKEFEPVDLRFRPDSMERLIELLGGKSLYGDDSFAPLRELLQNAVDAVRLRRTVEAGEGVAPRDGLIQVEVKRSADRMTLIVTDDGVGMSERVISNYLLGIASNYWQSSDFYADHPSVAKTTFQPIGRFGIGFLSVFMIGQDVTVTTQRHGGGNALELKLYGIGRRGALRRRDPRLRTGTAVALQLRDSYEGIYRQLHQVVQARAPMLDLPVEVSEGEHSTLLESGWWRRVSQEEFGEFLLYQPRRASATTAQREREKRFMRFHYTQGRLVDFAPTALLDRWLGEQPEAISDQYRVLAVPGASGVLLCSHGFAVRWVEVPGLSGIVDDPDVALTASRSAALQWSADDFRERLMATLRPKIADAMERLKDDVSIPSRFPFLTAVARAYGGDLLLGSSLPWMTILERPGHARLIAAAQLREAIRDARELVITYGTGPWNAVSNTRELLPEATSAAVVIPVSDARQPTVREADAYEERQQILTASLPEHFRQRKEELGSRLPEAVLLNLTLELIASEWGRSVADLELALWRSKSTTMCGLLLR